MNKIEAKKFGTVYVATDGERSAIGKTKKDAIKAIEEMQALAQVAIDEQVAKNNAVPLENSKEGHPFDPFGGTSWAGKRNSFD
jgi:hypothetical protein